jgi:hypothetical protein
MGVFIGQRFNDNILKQINTRINKITGDNGLFSDRSPEQLIHLNSKTSWIKLTSDVNINNSNELAKQYQLTSTIKQNNNFGNNGVYSLGNELGYRPFPGITRATIKSKGAFGSLREATVSFYCWDLEQLSILELLYLRPGFFCLLEWGHTIFYDNNNNLQQKFVTLDEPFLSGNSLKEQMLLNIENNRNDLSYNYDAMFGYIKNYSWELMDNGGYECTTNIVSIGDVIESIKINTIYNEDGDDKLIEEWKNKKIFSNKSILNDNSEKGLENKIKINEDIDSRLKQIEDIKNKYNELGLVEETQTQFKRKFIFLKSLILNSYLFPLKGVKFKTGDFSTINNLTKSLNELSSDLVSQQDINKEKNKLDNNIKGYTSDSLSTINNEIRKSFESYLELIENNFNKKKQKLAKSLPEEIVNSSVDNPIFLFSDILSSKLNKLLFQLYNKGSKTQGEFIYNDNNVFFNNNDQYNNYKAISIPLPKNIKEEQQLFPNFFIYVPLGALLSMINEKLVLYESKNNLPLVSIDNDIDSNLCLTHPLQISSDPSICIIPYQKEAETIFNVKYNKIFNNNFYQKSKYSANPMFIYVNIGYIAEILHNTRDNKGQVYLQQFLSELMKGIQLSLGGINSFNVGYDENSNKIKIYDTQQIPGNSDQEPSEIPVFGLSSVVKNISLRSEVFSDLSNMIVIGAQAGNVSSIDSTSLNVYNKIANISSRMLTPLIDESQKNREKVNILENKEERDRIQATRLKSLINYFSLQIYPSFSYSSEDAESAKDNLRDYLSLEKSSDKNTQALDVIPLKISITLEGISGMKIGQAFKIPNNRLPAQYHDKIAFVITSLNHDINNNIWNTTLEGQMILLDKNRGNYDISYIPQYKNNSNPISFGILTPSSSPLPIFIPSNKSDQDWLKQIVLAEALGEGVIGMALVARNIFNRYSIAQQTKMLSTFQLNSYQLQNLSYRDIIFAPNQYEPVSNGRIYTVYSEEQLKLAQDAINIASNKALLTEELKKKNKNQGEIDILLNNTFFVAIYDNDVKGNLFTQPKYTTFQNHQFSVYANPTLHPEFYS